MHPRFYPLAALAAWANHANATAHGFASAKEYRHVRKRQKMARASRKVNR